MVLTFFSFPTHVLCSVVSVKLHVSALIITINMLFHIKEPRKDLEK